MRRISTATRVVDKFGAGKDGFTNGNPVGGVVSTDLEDVWFDHVQEEIATVIEGGGVALDPTKRRQLLDVLRGPAFPSTSGGANTYVVANAVPVLALASGMVQCIKVTAANTGASTFAPDGLTTKPIYGAGLQPLQGGELVADGLVVLRYLVAAGVNAGNGAWIVIESGGGARQVAAATKSSHAVSLYQLLAHYAWHHKLDILTASGDFTVPSDVYWLDVELWGGGGGGGGVGSPGSSGTGGGGGGGYSRKMIAVVPGQVIACTVGDAGFGGGGGGGGTAGGTTSFGAYHSATGGSGGGPNGVGTGGGGGSGTGGDLDSVGASGGGGNPSGYAGAGGSAPFGGAGGSAAPGPANTGTLPGGGGPGRGTNSAGSGANGAPGLIIVRY